LTQSGMTPLDSALPSPRKTAWRREAVVLVTAFAFCVLGGVVHVDDTLGWPKPAAYVVAVVSCAALLVRHRRPVVAVLATSACAMVVAPVGLLLTPLIVVPTVIAAYALAVRTDWRMTAAVLLPAIALVATVPVFFGALSWQDASRLVSVATFPLIAGVLGHAMQNRRAYLAAVEERAHRAEETRDSEARRRVGEERVRIARELHDLVAHQITLANAQATVAAHVYDSHPEQSRKNLDDLVETTSNALDDLRSTVGLLRQSGDAVAPAEPTPGLSQLDTLLESFRRAGLDVTVHEEGTARPLPPGVDLTAYRIIQEALTNVTKHAGSGSARVGLSWGRHRVAITVADDGTTERTTSNTDRAPGHGLIGMRERANAAGGQLFAGRSPEGGFLVSTDLPLPPVKEREEPS